MAKLAAQRKEVIADAVEKATADPSLTKE